MKNRVTNFKLMAIRADVNANCDNETVQGYLTSLHQISPTDYYTMVMAYFGGNIPTAKPYTVAFFNLDDVDCHSYHIKFKDENEFPSSNNNDIEVSIELGFIEGKYSIALFRGIVRLYAPDTFHFSNAINENSECKMAFYATKNGAPVYYGDLNDLYP